MRYLVIYEANLGVKVAFASGETSHEAAKKVRDHAEYLREGAAVIIATIGLEDAGAADLFNAAVICGGSGAELNRVYVD